MGTAGIEPATTTPPVLDVEFINCCFKTLFTNYTAGKITQNILYRKRTLCLFNYTLEIFI